MGGKLEGRVFEIFLFYSVLYSLLNSFEIVSGQGETYNAKCEVGTTAQNRTVDDCDKRKYLTCRNSRCECLDPENQIWTFEQSGTSPHTLLRFKRSGSLVRVKRSRRGGFRGSGKGGTTSGFSTGAKVAAGVAVGAAGGYLASNVINNLNTNPNYNQNQNYNNHNQDDYQPNRRFSCYGRVGGKCYIDSPFVSGQVTRIAKCVPFARCVQNGFEGGSSNGQQSRMGICECKSGYRANSQDYCEAGATILELSKSRIFLISILTTSLSLIPSLVC